MSSNSNTQVLQVRVQNICCAKEANLIKDALKDVEGIQKVSINIIGRTAYIYHQPSLITPVDIVDRLNTLHLGVSIITKGEEQVNINKKLRIVLFLKVLNVIVLSVLFIVILAVGIRKNIGRWISIPFIALGSIPLLIKLAFDIVRKVFINVNLLMSIAVVGTLLLDERLDTIIILYVFSIAELLENACRYKVEKDISELMHTTAETAVLSETNETVAVEKVEIGTEIIICAGERVPLDGDVVKGKASVDESSITGESTPVLKVVGDNVYSGTILQSGYLKVKTTADYSNSTVSRAKQLVEEAQSQTTRTAETINKFVKYFSPGILLISFLLFLVPFILYKEKEMSQISFHQWCIRALTVLLVACPCSLIMATPIPMICGITKAAKLGALVKGGMHLETLASVNFMVFDKTGTLTEGRFQVIHEYFEDLKTRDETLAMAAALETKSTHPVAACIVNYYSGCITDTIDEHGIKIALPDVSKFKNESGMGLSGIINEKNILVGSEDLMKTYGVPIEQGLHIKVNNWSDNGFNIVFVAADLKVASIFALADKCRESSRDAIEMLEERNVDCVILTGDRDGPAEMIRKIAGIKQCMSNMKPKDKYNWILEKRKEKRKKKKLRIGMVGDGINDCPSLALADVGIAIGPCAAALAVESADISLMSDNLTKIPQLIDLSRYCRKVIWQSITAAILIKILFMVAALFYKDALWLAVLADVLGLFTVSINGIRPLYFKRKVKETLLAKEDVES